MDSLKERLLVVRECLGRAKSLNQWLTQSTEQATVVDLDRLSERLVEVGRVRRELDAVQTAAGEALRRTEEAVKRDEVELRFCNGGHVTANNNNDGDPGPRDKRQVLDIIGVLTQELDNYLTMARGKSVTVERAMRDSLAVAASLRRNLDEAARLMDDFDAVRDAWPPIGAMPVDGIHEHIGVMEGARDRLVEPISHLVGAIKTQARGRSLSDGGQERVDATLRRWKTLQVSWNERSTELADRARSLAADPEFLLATAVEPPWKRAVLVDSAAPYYINHQLMTTSWDHPSLSELLRSMSDLDDVRFSAYRTALKLRRLQTALYLDLVSLESFRSTLRRRDMTDFAPGRSLTVAELVGCLMDMYGELERQHGAELIRVPLCADLCLNWLLNLYDPKRTGRVNALCFVSAVACLCKSPVADIYRFLFCRTVRPADPPLASIDRHQMALLVGALMRLPLQVCESRAFGGADPHASVRHCFATFGERERLEAAEFMDWMRLEPQSLVWLPVMHRLAEGESLAHQSRCVVCRESPVVGLLYRCLSRFNHDICQRCFYSARVARTFKFVYPIVEYATSASSTSGGKIRDVARIIRNKLIRNGGARSSSSGGGKRKVGYLPVNSPQSLTCSPASAHRDEASHSAISPPPPLHPAFPDIHEAIRACASRLSALEHLRDNGSLSMIGGGGVATRDKTPSNHRAHHRHSAVFESSEAGGVMHSAPMLRYNHQQQQNRVPTPVFEEYDNVDSSGAAKNFLSDADDETTLKTLPPPPRLTINSVMSSSSSSSAVTSPGSSSLPASANRNLREMPSPSFYINQLIGGGGFASAA